MKLVTKSILAFLILASFSTYSFADGNWGTCGGDGQTDTKSTVTQEMFVTSIVAIK